MKEQIANRLAALRKAMADAGVDAVIIPQTDPHQSEYLASHWQVRRFLSGFTGSAGSLVVTADEALLWTDSRYFIQAAAQLADTPIILMKDGLPDTPSIEKYLIDHLHSDSVVGIDGMLFSSVEAERLRSVFESHRLRLRTDFDPVNSLWPDRPALPKGRIFVHDERYAGESPSQKIDRILDKVAAVNANAIFISPLDEIAWTLNIRSNDVRYNPVATAYLYLSNDDKVLFTDPEKLDEEAIDHLNIQGVRVMSYHAVKSFLASLPDNRRVLIEGTKTSTAIATVLGSRAVFAESPVAMMKGCRNARQVDGIRDAMVRDGVAMVRSLIDIEKAVAAGNAITEMDVAAILLRHRSAQPLFFDESFGTIAGYGEHGAIVHYEADETTNVALEPHGLLLIDSGAQYLDGTTDITRTIALGEPTDLERHDFTLVMKGHIALASVVFPEGTRGVQLDALARQFLWKEGLSYLHGTGHGVGHFLNVHEGPQTIRLNYTPAPLVPGMITSNEPGLYREGIHGIRCENLMLCVPAMTTDFGSFLRFDTVTLCPFDRKLFQTDIMSPEEIAWVNDYHARVRSELSPFLTADERAWLETATLPL